MKIREILIEYQTKTGEEITLKHTEDAEKIQAPWVVHRIDAYIGEEHAGYITISYVPKENIKKYLPNIFNYLSKVKGMSILPHEDKSTLYSKLSHEQLIDRFPMAYYYTNRERYPEYKSEVGKYIYKGKSVDDYSREELIKIYKEFEKSLVKTFGKQFEEFKKFHINKPLIDYIRVNEPDDEPKRFRRKRIGEALYIAGTKWMNSKGMKLYASGLQSDPAIKAWAHLAKIYNVQTDKRGKHIKL